MVTVYPINLGAARPVQRAAHGQAAAVEDVGIDHCRLHVLVAEQFLDRADVVTVLQEVGGEAVAKGMAVDALGQAGLLGRPTDGLLQSALVDVVAAEQPGLGMPGQFGGGEDVLPGPLAVGMGILAFEGEG